MVLYLNFIFGAGKGIFERIFYLDKEICDQREQAGQGDGRGLYPIPNFLGGSQGG